MTRNEAPEGAPLTPSNHHHGTTHVALTGDPETDAAEILEHLDPRTARCLAFELERAADEIDRPTRRSPYIGPSCDHPAGAGYVYFETLAVKERIGARP